MIKRTLIATIATFAFAAPAIAADPILVRVGQPASPRSHINANLLSPWTEQITKDSKGTLNVKLFAGGTLGGNREAYDSVKNGVADVIYLSSAYYPGKFPKSAVVGLPGESSNSLDSSLAVWKLYQDGVIADEWSDFRILGMFVFPPASIHATFPIKRLEDLKGRKIGAGSATSVAVIKALGAIPVRTGFTEVYQSLSRNTIEAYSTPWTGMQPIRLWEVAKFHTDVKLGGASTVVMAMNKESYAKLPSDGRAAVDMHSGRSFTHALGAFWDHVDDTGKKLVEKHADNQIYTLPKDEAVRWSKALSSITDEWVKTTEGGAAVLAAFREARDKAAMETK